MEPMGGLCLHDMTELQPGYIKSELIAATLSVSLHHPWVSADPITKRELPDQLDQTQLR